MGWLLGSFYGFIMLFFGFYLADYDWGSLIENPESYKCSLLDLKEVCDKKMQIKEILTQACPAEEVTSVPGTESCTVKSADGNVLLR